MTDNEIIIYLVILLVVVLLLYWFSNNIGKHKKNKTKKEIIHNEKIKQQEIIMPQEPVIKTNNLHIAPELENINKTLSIADIIENKIPVAPIIQNEPIIPVEIEQKNLDMEKPIQEIDYNQDNVNSFVIGELTEEETYEEEIKEEENIEPEEQSKSSLAPLLTTALSIPLLKKDKEKDNSENYINYKPKENNVMKVDNSVSLNNEKCAYFQYDLLPDWLKDLMQKENYNLVITNDESLTKDSAALFTPMEKQMDRYMIFQGENEKEIEHSILITVGHFVDNYLGNLADAPQEEQIDIKLFSVNSNEWLEIYEKNKHKLKKQGISSPSSYFANAFRKYIISKEELRKKDNAAFKFVDQCMQVLEFHYQKDLVENNCLNLEDFKNQEKVNKFINIYEEPQEEQINNFNYYEYNNNKSR